MCTYFRSDISRTVSLEFIIIAHPPLHHNSMRVVHLLCKVNFVIDAGIPTTIIVGTIAARFFITYAGKSFIHLINELVYSERITKESEQPRPTLIKKAVQERNAAFLLHFFVA